MFVFFLGTLMRTWVNFSDERTDREPNSLFWGTGEDDSHFTLENEQLEHKHEGLVEMIFLFQLGDFDVPFAVNFPGCSRPCSSSRGWHCWWNSWDCEKEMGGKWKNDFGDIFT